MSIHDAVVLAAGEGRRLRPLTRNRPKPLLPAANRPILEYVLDALLDAGIEHLVLVVGYRGDRVKNHVGVTYRGVPVTYATQEKQLGSGHALAQARGSVDGEFLVVNGDQLIEPAIVTDVVDGATGDAAATLAVIRSAVAPQYGAVTMDGDRVTALVERPSSDEYRLLNAGVYAVDESIFGAIERTEHVDGELRLPDALSTLVDREAGVRGVLTDGMWADATYPWDLLSVSRELLDRGRVDQPARRDEVWVSEGARVHETAVLRAPVVVGPDTEVGPNAVVGPTVALGPNVTVGAGAIVERSVLDADTRVAPGATLRDCVTGQGVRLGPGVTVTGPGDVRIGDRVFRDRELGAVFADRVHAGARVSVEPGALVGPNARLGTGVHVSGNVSEGVEVQR